MMCHDNLVVEYVRSWCCSAARSQQVVVNVD